jgi:hypothetical protein
MKRNIPQKFNRMFFSGTILSLLVFLSACAPDENTRQKILKENIAFLKTLHENSGLEDKSLENPNAGKYASLSKKINSLTALFAEEMDSLVFQPEAANKSVQLKTTAFVFASESIFDSLIMKEKMFFLPADTNTFHYKCDSVYACNQRSENLALIMAEYCLIKSIEINNVLSKYNPPSSRRSPTSQYGIQFAVNQHPDKTVIKFGFCNHPYSQKCAKINLPAVKNADGIIIPCQPAVEIQNDSVLQLSFKKMNQGKYSASYNYLIKKPDGSMISLDRCMEFKID